MARSGVNFYPGILAVSCPINPHFEPPSADFFIHRRPDLVYVSRTPEHSQGRSTTATPRTPSRPGSEPQAPSRTRNPPASNSTRARFITPPPTPRTTPARRSPHRRDVPQTAGHPAAPIIGSQRRLLTLVYPPLREERMLEYFVSDDGVSYRPHDGRSTHLCSDASIANAPELQIYV